MRRIAIPFCFLIITAGLRAQSITLDPISKLMYCDGDSITISYQASGTFAADNHFFVELSDANGSFNSFSSFGNDTSMNAFFKIKLSTLNSGDRMRIASTDPYTISDTSNSIEIHALPNPDPWASKYKLNIGVDEFDTIICGLISQNVTFGDWNYQSGNNYIWKFNQDAEPSSSTLSNPIVMYSQSGIKTGTEMVTTPSGCSIKIPFQFRIADCNPVIPADVHVVTDSESGYFGSVWVKAGGKFVQSSGATPVHFGFIESGASLVIDNPGGSYFYVKSGASVILTNNGPGVPLLILQSGANVVGADTFYCPELTFDYSQIPSSVLNPPVSAMTIRQPGDHLFATDENEPIDIRISNLLGTQILAQHGSGTLDVDLSSLAAGVYFAVVQAGGEETVRKIAVVH